MEFYQSEKKKNFCTTKKIIDRMRIQPMDWEKIFSNHTSDNGPISKIYKQHKQLNSKKKN